MSKLLPFKSCPQATVKTDVLDRAIGRLVLSRAGQFRARRPVVGTEMADAVALVSELV